MQKVTLSLWFNGCAEQAAAFYISCFGDGRIIDVSRHGEGGPRPAGEVMAVTFELFGQRYAAINGGPEFAFSPALSLLVSCETQDEIDRYWAKLAEGGKPARCGWITDRFGVTWQIIPAQFKSLLSDSSTAGRVMAAACRMEKIDLAALERAASE
ncbi:VOC family protein [Rhodoblastus sp.]|uniref:VOC family protein n=1 Tax=Rhodoblastus sp. TaxID=1962975 RepID=UPI0035B1E717